MLPGWSIFRPWPTSRGKTKCFIWAADLIMGSMAFCISGGKQYRQQRAAFWAGLCICRQHCAVNGINVRKIIRCLLLPQFAVRHQRTAGISFISSSFFICFIFFLTSYNVTINSILTNNISILFDNNPIANN